MPTGFKVADAFVSVHLDDSEAKQGVRDLPRRLGPDTDKAGGSVGKRMGAAVGKGLDPEATKAGRSAGDKISRGVEQSINHGNFGTALKRQVDSAIKSLPQVNLLNLDVKSTAEMDRLRRDLESLSSKKIGVDFSAEEAVRQIAEVEAQLRALGRETPHIQLKADTAAAAAELAAFRTRIAKSGTDSGNDFAASLSRAMGPAMKRSGDDAGGTLAQGMRQSVTRNSPLIVAGISAALAAGAPAAIAGATVLFAGIGVAAAAMNDEVQKHWSAAWQLIVTGTKQDASVLQKTVADLGDRVGAAFQRMRPLMQDAFVALAPMIDKFTNSLLGMVQNALPGLVHAVEAAGPVMDGLGSLVENIGTGLGEFFDIIAQHSGAAGQAFDAIGRIVGALLPILGQLVGAGAELASQILPPLASALEGVADALDTIAPVLPAVLAGFLAFKGVSVVTSAVNGLSTSLGSLAAKGLPGISTAAGSASGALSKFGAALPAIGIATAGLTVALQDSAEQQDKVTAGLEGLYRTVQLGGPQAAQAQELLNAAAKNGSSSFLGLGADVDTAMKQADAATQQWWNSMSPLQQAQEIVTARQNDLNAAIEKYGPNSLQANEAAQAYRDAQAEVAAQEAATQLAINGVTDAMLAQANQALANASSSFAYDQATQQVADAQAKLAEVQKDSKSTSSDLSNATLSLNQALLSQVEAAGRLASDSLPATASETQKATAANGAMLQQLYVLRDQMGSAFPAALQNAIVGLQNSGATANNYSAQAYGALSATQNLIGGLFNLGQQHPQPAVTVQPGNSIGILNSVKAGIDRLYSKTIYVNTINTVRNILGMGSAAGGAVNQIPVIKAASGRVVGPGTGTSDSVPAIGPNGQPWALSNGEWVIRDAAVRALEQAFGPSAMPTINSGRLPVATNAGSSGSMSKVQGGAIGGNNTYVTVNVNGVAFADSIELPRTLTRAIQQGLVKIEREQH